MSSSSPPPDDGVRRLQKAERREQIMEVAREMYRTQSYDEINIKGVAERAGISHGLIYHYFPSKESLFLAVVEEGIREMLESMAPATAAASTSWPEAGLEAIRKYFDFAQENSRVYLNIFQGPVAGMPELQAVCEAARTALGEALLGELLAQRKSLPTTRLLVRAAQSYVESCAFSWLKQPDGVRREELESACMMQIGLALVTGVRADLPADDEVRRQIETQETAFRAYFEARRESA
jgi:AcrR family transcriptional regulator